MNISQKILPRFIFTFVLLGAILGFTSVANSRCNIEIVKSANPADNTPFDFSSPNTSGFTLMDPDDNEFTFVVSTPRVTFEVTELTPLEWVLESIECETDGPVQYLVNGPTVK